LFNLKVTIGKNSISLRLYDMYMSMYQKKLAIMKDRIYNYEILIREDMNNMENREEWERETEYKRQIGIISIRYPLTYVVCLIDKNAGFIGMIYASFKIYKVMNVGGPLLEHVKSIEIYGIRSLFFTQHGVVDDLFDGIFQYGKELRFELVHVDRTPMGPMSQKLSDMDFSMGRFKSIESYDEPRKVKVLHLGCQDIIRDTDNLIYYSRYGYK
jgi:hypothetical protein